MIKYVQFMPGVFFQLGLFGVDQLSGGFSTDKYKDKLSIHEDGEGIVLKIESPGPRHGEEIRIYRHAISGVFRERNAKGSTHGFADEIISASSMIANAKPLSTPGQEKRKS